MSDAELEEPDAQGPEQRPTEAQQTQASAIIQSTFGQLAFSGPLPPPEMLRQYDQILPGCAERIVSLTERQSQHRQEIERQVISADIRNQSRAQMFAFVIAITAIIGGVVLIALDKSVAGLATIITAVGSLVGIFVYSRRKQDHKLPTQTDADLEPRSSD